MTIFAGRPVPDLAESTTALWAMVAILDQLRESPLGPFADTPRVDSPANYKNRVTEVWPGQLDECEDEPLTADMQLMLGPWYERGDTAVLADRRRGSFLAATLTCSTGSGASRTSTSSTGSSSVTATPSMTPPSWSNTSAPASSTMSGESRYCRTTESSTTRHVAVFWPHSEPLRSACCGSVETSEPMMSSFRSSGSVS